MARARHEHSLPPLKKGRSVCRKRVDARFRRAMANRVGIKTASNKSDPHPNPPLFKGRERAADADPPHAIALPRRGRVARGADSRARAGSGLNLDRGQTPPGRSLTLASTLPWRGGMAPCVVRCDVSLD